jgi:hypothetical protein
MFRGFNCPDITMILIDGQRSCTVRASPKPSMLPGIWMSVHMSAMSDLDSRPCERFECGSPARLMRRRKACSGGSSHERPSCRNC